MAAMRYRLRTLLIAGAIVPPIIAGAWWLGLEGLAIVLTLAMAAGVLYLWVEVM